MSDLARIRFSLTESFTNNPLVEIFEKGSAMMPGSSLQAKTRFIGELAIAIEKLEENSERIQAQNYWTRIVSGFSAAFAIGSSTALNPVLGGIIGGSAVVSAIANAWCCTTENTKLEPLTQTLKRVRLAIKKHAPAQWAALWEIAGTDLFVHALRPASAGQVLDNGQLVQMGEDSPIQRAIQFVAEMKGLEFMDVVEEGRRLLGKEDKSPVASESDVVAPAIAPTVIQTPVTRIQQEKVQEQIEQQEDVFIDEEPEDRLASELFDWNDLRDPEEHPVIALVAGMGGGKTRLVKYLTRHVIFDGAKEFDAIAFDIFAGGADWDGFTPICQIDQMAEQMHKDLEILAKRLEAYRKKVRNFVPMIRVIEEGRSTIPKLQKLDSEVLENWQLEFTSVVRKLRGRAFYINTELDAASMGVKAKTRNDMTIIFPGNKGIFKAMSDTTILKLGSKQNEKVRNELNRKLKKCDRPALVYHCGQWYAADIPTLDENGTPSWHEDYIDENTPRPSVTDVKYEETNWNRFVLESTEEEINELIEQNRTKKHSSESGSDAQECEPVNRSPELLNHSPGNTSSEQDFGSEKRFTSLNLPESDAKAWILRFKTSMNQTQIIETLWQVTKGGTESWKNAREEYRYLTGE